MDTTIKITNLSVSIGKSTEALKEVSLTIPKNKIVGFIGPSGAGKTTLIRAIVGRQKITTGTIEINNLSAGSKHLRKHISYMTQETSVYPDLTVKENMQYFATIRGVSKKSIPKIVKNSLQDVGMSSFENQLVGTLSGGQKQRISLAVTLLGNPDILMLDEPTVGLDPLLREEIWKLFKQIANDGKTIVISSHVMDEAEKCDELLLIRDGRVIAYDSPINLKLRTKSKSVEESFLKLVGINE